MPQQVEWLVDQRILFSTLWGELTLEDIMTNSNVGIGMSEAVSHDHLIHTILEGRGIIKMPSLRDQLTMKVKRASNTGWIIIILNPNRLYKFMGSTVMQLTGSHYRLLESWEEAVNLLTSVDTTLPNLSSIPEKMEMLFKESQSQQAPLE
jgi:hypothetical protein